MLPCGRAPSHVGGHPNCHICMRIMWEAFETTDTNTWFNVSESSLLLTHLKAREKIVLLLPLKGGGGKWPYSHKVKSRRGKGGHTERCFGPCSKGGQVVVPYRGAAIFNSQKINWKDLSRNEKYEFGAEFYISENQLWERKFTYSSKDGIYQTNAVKNVTMNVVMSLGWSKRGSCPGRKNNGCMPGMHQGTASLPPHHPFS